MPEQLSKSLTNQQKLDFLPDAIVTGGDTMKDGKSLQTQIAEAPEAALWLPLIDWGDYKTSVLQQLAYNARAAAQGNSELVAIRSLLTQVLSQVTNGVPVDIDYDRIAEDIKANMPEFEIIKKEG
ncbi:hypothetical protein [Arthrobacter sp. ISL-95]|uniref:hypothetical protein n=1 Tax=Arthrobacter sp. ISL-95 TaxID=2819116 RepID=UPI001BEA2A17|nr:hypothetical protein [Arthrobacter sp. ISL-95]MBT2587958.1 hypothetical protein [Arthrobacter sp. ISL-95]